MSISQTYQHLNAQERAVIMLCHGAGFSVRAIARTLARSPSTIWMAAAPKMRLKALRAK